MLASPLVLTLWFRFLPNRAQDGSWALAAPLLALVDAKTAAALCKEKGLKAGSEGLLQACIAKLRDAAKKVRLLDPVLSSAAPSGLVSASISACATAEPALPLSPPVPDLDTVIDNQEFAGGAGELVDRLIGTALALGLLRALFAGDKALETQVRRGCFLHFRKPAST